MIHAKHMCHVAYAGAVLLRFQCSIIVQHPAKLQAHIMVSDLKSAFLADPEDQRIAELPVFPKTEQLLPAVLHTVIDIDHIIPVKHFPVHRDVAKTAL